MFSKLRTILQDVFELEGGSASDSSMELAIAGLLSEVAAADHDVDPREAEVKVHMLEKLLETDASEAEVYMNNARNRAKESVSLYEYTDKLRQLSQEQRYKLIEAMWQVAWQMARLTRWKMPSSEKRLSCCMLTMPCLSKPNWQHSQKTDINKRYFNELQ